MYPSFAVARSFLQSWQTGGYKKFSAASYAVFRAAIIDPAKP
jgi:hypothetical protein